jgi:hypothetical protein
LKLGAMSFFRSTQSDHCACSHRLAIVKDGLVGPSRW